MTPESFANLRYGMIVHYGVYSLLERAEWVLNRERIPLDEYRRLANRFTAEKFDAEALCDLAVRAGMRYIVFTTMHQDGFRLYDTAFSDFNSFKAPSHRDLTGEIVTAARRRGLRIGLYHSLNNQMDQPDAVAALEDPAAYRQFIQNTHRRFEEVVRRYNPVDVLWYDGWWPFNAQGWEAETLNKMVKEIQPHILFNGRNGLPGDFATPEGHLSAPKPWRPWEACITHNNNWGYHRGDHEWKTPGQVVDMLATVAADRGNLLLNVGPRGDGSIPTEAVEVLEAVGQWLKRCGESIMETEPFTYGLQERGQHRGDWCHHGPFTARGNFLYLLLRRWPGNDFAIGGLECKVKGATLLGMERPPVDVKQTGDRITIKGLPDQPTDPVCPVLRLECDRPPTMYLTAGVRVPRVAHPPYDPCPSDLAHG
jgi:alpha-L-fucosidase